MSGPYDAIIHLPRPVSSRHLPMSMHDRAAQFSPFAALTGYDAAIRETARTTDLQKELTDSGMELLDKKLRLLQAAAETHPEVQITFFQPDRYKSGGSYRRITGYVKKVDYYDRVLLFQDGTFVSFWQLYSVEGECIPDE